MLEVARVDGLEWEASHGIYSAPVTESLGIRQWLSGVACKCHL